MDNQVLFQQLGVIDEMSDIRVRQIVETVQPYSMVHESGILFTIAAAIYAVKYNLPGVFVECGAWRGGCSVAMLLAQLRAFGKISRRVYILDSFEGLPRVDKRDGPLAAMWQAGADPEKYFDNCKAAEADLDRLLQLHNFSCDDYRVIRGWFANSVPELAGEIKKKGISLLRLDSDWYASTEICLKYLCPQVSDQGVVIVDDYYAWDGCARAVHDYLSGSDLPYRIKSLPYCFGAYFIKRPFRANFNEF